MGNIQTYQDKINSAAENSGDYFRRMAEFVGFDQDQAAAIFESRFIIEKYIPDIVAQFYINLLQYPLTRQFFLRPDGTINEEYVAMRMSHLGNFWRRTANGPYDDDYARYIDYVGRAHTKRGADPRIDIPERYVIGQVGFVQHAIAENISKELHAVDPEWEVRALKAWNLLMMVILELLSRAYGDEQAVEPAQYEHVEPAAIQGLAVDAYERSLGIHKIREIQQSYYAAEVADIPLNERKLVNIGGLTIGIFHQASGWYAIKNRCLHAGGPVAEGRLEDETLTCPWHGYQYNLPSGALLRDPSARLEMYPVEIMEGKVFLKLPVLAGMDENASPAPEPVSQRDAAQAEPKLIEANLAGNEFLLDALIPGGSIVVEVEGLKVAVFSVDGKLFALDNACTHVGGPLSEGKVDGLMVICPWHGSCFNLETGEVLCGPAKRPVKTYQVVLENGVGRVS
jgi:3-phenylpropionate/trans-cinnamate dioxygenase ferredoxin component